LGEKASSVNVGKNAQAFLPAETQDEFSNERQRVSN
jgi:hypothetical protein